MEKGGVLGGNAFLPPIKAFSFCFLFGLSLHLTSSLFGGSPAAILFVIREANTISLLQFGIKGCAVHYALPVEGVWACLLGEKDKDNYKNVLNI